MEPRRNLARRTGLVALAALLVLGASACSGSTGLVGQSPAATVDDAVISQADVVSGVEATKRFYEDSIAAGQDTDGQLASLLADLKGPTTDSISTKGASQVLSDMIIDEAMHQFLAERDALPTAADRKALRTQIESQVGGAAALKKLDAEYIRIYVERKTLNDAFAKWAAAQEDKKAVALTPAEREAKMRELYAQTQPNIPLCLNAIQVATEDEAKAAKARVDAGEDFVAVATDVAPEGSTVPKEGLVACLSFENAQSSFGQDFSKSKVGDIVGPVEYAPQGSAPSFLVLRVDDLDGQTYEQMLPQLEAAIPVKPEPIDPTTFDASKALDKVLRDADIQVSSMYGTWNAKTQSVVPPRVPTEPGATTSTIPVLTTAGS